MLISAYRADQYSDPEGYMASLGMVLEQYPDDVVVYITDPRTGIQRRRKWPPAISEIVEACDQHHQYLNRIDHFKNWGKKPAQIEQPNNEERPTLEQLHAKYGKDWGLKTLDEPPKSAKPAPAWDEIIALYQAQPSRLEALVKTGDNQGNSDEPKTA
jgi:hypothetical protein